LGRYAFGKSVGALSIHEKYPSNVICKPCCLGFLYPSGTNNTACEMITNSAGIRQVKVPEGLANVVIDSAYKYSIGIYSPSVVSTNKDTNGLYTFSGAALATVTVENPDGSTATNKLRITD
jgi:hypothetical protein